MYGSCIYCYSVFSDGYTTDQMLLKWKKGFDKSKVSSYMRHVPSTESFYIW
jgi:hypothetical protein